MSNHAGSTDSLLPGNDWSWPVTNLTAGLLGNLLPLQVGSKVWVMNIRGCGWPGPERPNNTVGPAGPSDFYIPIGPDDPGSPDIVGFLVGALAASE